MITAVGYNVLIGFEREAALVVEGGYKPNGTFAKVALEV
jgi:hypothetical protein